jgi:hypothetical protein
LEVRNNKGAKRDAKKPLEASEAIFKKWNKWRNYIFVMTCVFIESFPSILEREQTDQSVRELFWFGQKFFLGSGIVAPFLADFVISFRSWDDRSARWWRLPPHVQSPAEMLLRLLLLSLLLVAGLGGVLIVIAFVIAFFMHGYYLFSSFVMMCLMVCLGWARVQTLRVGLTLGGEGKQVLRDWPEACFFACVSAFRFLRSFGFFYW